MIYDDIDKSVAIHEAGHAIIADSVGAEVCGVYMVDGPHSAERWELESYAPMADAIAPTAAALVIHRPHDLGFIEAVIALAGPFAQQLLVADIDVPDVLASSDGVAAMQAIRGAADPQRVADLVCKLTLSKVRQHWRAIELFAGHLMLTRGLDGQRLADVLKACRVMNKLEKKAFPLVAP